MKTRVTYCETPKHPTCSHRVRYPGADGKMLTKWFTNETDTLAFVKKKEDEIGFNGSDFGTISSEERDALAFWRSFKVSTPTAPDLPVVLRGFSKTWKEKNESVTITDALDKYVVHQEAEGASARHIASIKSRVKRLATDHGDKLVAAMDSGTFADWLNGLRGTRADKAGDKLSMTTRDNLKKTCRTFFSFCIERGWTSTNPVPIAAKKRTKSHRIAKRTAPAIMLPADVEKFLHKVEEVATPILPFWLIKFFAGIRDAEAGRLDWSMIDLKEGFIRVPAAVSKTGDDRKVKIEPMLRDWLVPYARKAGPLVEVKEHGKPTTTLRYYYKKVLRHLRNPETKGGKPRAFVFPSNAARHSFGTFHLFHFRNPGETAIQLGHKGNPTMLWEHYANPAAEEHAAAFWAIKSGKEKGREHFQGKEDGMKLIPNPVLWEAYAEAAVPVKSISPHSVAIWNAVVNLKASVKAKHGEAKAWERLREVMDETFTGGAGAMMDEVAKAQTRAEVSVKRKWTIRQDGRDPVELTAGQIHNSPRRPKTIAIIEAIMRLQRDAKRAPTRQEILDAVGESRVDGLSEDELSRQLTGLGWNDLLS